ncbi:hypothetical protein B0H12DRAFT_846934 [Mycena haematopus]|nr:hypothetical protein B0H12DRAFT_846934 [Mycena haematopus]
MGVISSKILDALFPMAETSPFSKPSVLPRNQACYSCRRRKMRCDGQRPVCGPCLRASREDDCEYTDNLGRSRAQMLEEDIARVQTRIYQLEHPEAGSSSVPLHEPYTSFQSSTQIPGISQILSTFSGPVLSGPPDMFMESETGTSATIPDSWWNSDEPPKHMAQSFLDTFLSYASDWGFFLDLGNFRRDALLPLPIGHHSRPSPALLAAVYLAGITLSVSPTLKMHEKTFLARALSALPSSLSSLHPRKALHALQAEIILATYFFSAGKFVEGMYHTAAAVSLAVSSGMHEAFAETPSLPSAHAIDSEEVERFDACWAIITLDKAWAMALGTPSNWNDTLVQPRSHETGDNENIPIDEMLPKTLLAKAVVLWERANSLAAQWNPGSHRHRTVTIYCLKSWIEMSVQESHEFFIAFNTLEERIDNFRRDVTAIAAESTDVRSLIVVCSIAHTAAIQLHAPFGNNENSHRKCVDAATAVLTAVADANLVDCVYINPIMAPVWAAACRVVIEELRAREGRSSNGALVATFERGFAAVRGYAVSCPLMRYYIDEIQEAYNTLDGRPEDAVAEL